jgi:hypothetical protein
MKTHFNFKKIPLPEISQQGDFSWFPIFRPVPGKFREGKQVYLCGRRNVYLDRYPYIKQFSRSGPGALSWKRIRAHSQGFYDPKLKGHRVEKFSLTYNKELLLDFS